MRNHGLFAFVLTTAVLVPAAAHYLTAGHEQVLRFAAGSGGELTVNGATVHATLAQPLVDPGEPLKIKLTASGAKGKQLAVGLLVYGSSGDEGSRVPSPPVGVAHKTVTIPLDAEGNGAAELAIPLRGAVANVYSSLPFTGYEVLVMAPKAADRLERLRKGAAFVGDASEIPEYNAAGSKFMSLYAWHGERTGQDVELFAEGAVARLDAHTRAINPAIAISTPDTVEVGKPFTVAITVRNTSKQPARGYELQLETPLGVVEEIEDERKPGPAVEALVMPDELAFDLEPGESKRLEFRVMPSELGIVGLYAHATCHGECEERHPLTLSGTFDAVEIVKPVAVDAPSIVGTR